MSTYVDQTRGILVAMQTVLETLSGPWGSQGETQALTGHVFISDRLRPQTNGETFLTLLERDNPLAIIGYRNMESGLSDDVIYKVAILVQCSGMLDNAGQPDELCTAQERLDEEIHNKLYANRTLGGVVYGILRANPGRSRIGSTPPPQGKANFAAYYDLHFVTPPVLAA